MDAILGGDVMMIAVLMNHVELLDSQPSILNWCLLPDQTGASSVGKAALLHPNFI